jgi:hypothetical protein
LACQQSEVLAWLALNRGDLTPAVIDQFGRLAIAKFPKGNDEYSIELWETAALQLAAKAGIVTPKSELLQVAGKPAIVKEVGDVTSKWRDVATALGARKAEIQRMESAFEHIDLTKALAL